MSNDDDKWPAPLTDPDEIARARKAFADTYAIRRRILRYAYLALAVLIVLVIYLAMTH